MLSIVFLGAFQIGLANTTGTENNTVSSEKKEQLPTETGQQSDFQEKLDEDSFNDEEMETDQDSIEDDSVNKYNFIFYFLYKFKYDHEETTI